MGGVVKSIILNHNKVLCHRWHNPLWGLTYAAHSMRMLDLSTHVSLRAEFPEDRIRDLLRWCRTFNVTTQGGDNAVQVSCLSAGPRAQNMCHWSKLA